MVFAVASADGNLYVYDLNENMGTPVVTLTGGEPSIGMFVLFLHGVTNPSVLPVEVLVLIISHHLVCQYLQKILLLRVHVVQKEYV